MSNYLPLILQAIITVSAVSTFLWKLQTDSSKKLSEKIKAAQLESDEKIKINTKEVEALERKQREDVRDLHARIDEKDDFVKKQIIGKLSKMEGEMKQMSNILHVIQEHFIKTGVGKR